MSIVVFVGFAALQITISHFIYSMLQGRDMSMQPAAVIVVLLFWGWLWGVTFDTLSYQYFGQFLRIVAKFTYVILVTL